MTHHLRAQSIDLVMNDNSAELPYDSRLAFGNRSRADSSGSTRRALVPSNGPVSTSTADTTQRRHHRRKQFPSVPKPSPSIDRIKSPDTRTVDNRPHQPAEGVTKSTTNNKISVDNSDFVAGLNFVDSNEYPSPARNDVERGVPLGTETNPLLVQPPPYSYDPSLSGGLYDSLEKNNEFSRQNEINNFSQLANADQYYFDPRNNTNIFHSKSVEHETRLNRLFVTLRETIHEIITVNFYNEDNPEFTSRQQIAWAVIFGIVMGIFTAKWNQLIDFAVEFIWIEVPEKLVDLGVFTDLDGLFPLPHYMWICPAIFGGVLSYVTAILPKPIPGQNEWIESLHHRGYLDHSTILYTFVISTAGMMSGLSLGPELPLILISGMVGSYLGLRTRQTLLSVRVMNLTAAAAAIGGFFGFPLSGAIFVLEVPHQMGLQYFEALNPAVVSSIFAVIFNRIVTGDELKGKFSYPTLRSRLPSDIFFLAILYGLVGCLSGQVYVKACVYVKTKTHDWFHSHDEHSHGHGKNHNHKKKETHKLNGASDGKHNENEGFFDKVVLFLQKSPTFVIKHEPRRAAVVGIIAGALVGVISMFLPHNLFWGEAQLQTLLDSGKSRLPVIGGSNENTSDMIAYGYCLPNHLGDEGFTISCSILIVITKMIVIGLSLGTGIVGGHFWGPLYVGAASANVYTSVLRAVSEVVYERYGDSVLGGMLNYLTEYPTLALICMMGSCHVVTFKANIAIMLILILTVKEFVGSEHQMVSEYSAIFPLLVVSTFTSLMFSRRCIFYKKQRCRVDLIVSPPSLCEPGKDGDVIHHDDDSSGSGSGSGSSVIFSSDDDSSLGEDDSLAVHSTSAAFTTPLTQAEIESNFIENNIRDGRAEGKSYVVEGAQSAGIKPTPAMSDYLSSIVVPNAGTTIDSDYMNSIPRSTPRGVHHRPSSGDTRSDVSTGGLNTVTTIDSDFKSTEESGRRHKRSQSDGAAFAGFPTRGRTRSNSLSRSTRSRHPVSDKPSSIATTRRRISSYGEFTETEIQPSLLDQARERAASTSSRRSKSSSFGTNSMANQVSSENAGGLPPDLTERAFNSKVLQDNLL